MGKESYRIEGTAERSQMVDQIRRAARQFAMLYFHFVKTLYDAFGRDRAMELVQRTIFDQGADRAVILREKAISQGLPTETEKDFMAVSDLPMCGWIAEWGEDHCPYAVIWRGYAEKYPWFREFATFYCDVIDTTTIEVFTERLSHRITANVITAGTKCEREYFESGAVKEGRYTYGAS